MRSGPRAPGEGPRTTQSRRADDSEGALIEARGVHQAFGDTVAIEALDLVVGRGEVLGVVGPSGCGKSTLLELIAGLREPTAGTIAVAGGSAPAARLEHCAYMPQRDLLLPWLSALDNAALALRCGGERRADARAGAHELFVRFGLAGFERATPGELSGGMRQRIAFLRTLLAGKPVLLLDEPFASLDAITRGEMQEWLAAALGDRERCVIVVSHDVDEALFLADRVVVLSARPGRVVAAIEAPAPRTLPRLEAITSEAFLDARREALTALDGERS